MSQGVLEQKAAGITVRRVFTEPGMEPFDVVEWERRDVEIVAPDGRKVFEQRGVEVPLFWSQTAAQVVASKYFRGSQGSPEREHSVRQLIGRVVDEIARWGEEDGYFATGEDAAAFRAELQYLLLHQRGSFNSPVWFNVGIDPKPQCSACFINGVEDDMAAILELAKTEALLFQKGSGAGSNLSALRSSFEELSGGGHASGPVSFMRGFDAFAGVIKSGGRTRRAAKMVVLDVDHPDIVEFIEAKTREEGKAAALVAAGYPADFDDLQGAYGSVFFQNANHSVRVPDTFLEAVEQGERWTTHGVTDGRPLGEHDARELLLRMADAAWACGDPGLQYDDAINRWHTCPESGRIRASNPCSEYLFLDDSACNLASLNLLRFDLERDGTPREEFDVEGFVHACEVFLTAQEILVDRAGYPTEKIRDNSHRFRPLGLGYANLGALLMARGVPYDSEEGRRWAGSLTALLTGAAYRQSARIAAIQGPFEGFAENREATLGVLEQHRDAVGEIGEAPEGAALALSAAAKAWQETVELARQGGVRNAQATVLAPTGTIAFMMDCATTGVEPELALVKEKRLVGGGSLRLVNTTVAAALERLGYGEEEVSALLAFVEHHGTLEGAPGFRAKHLPVFDCALPTPGSDRTIHYRGHLKMVAAVQPFLSGAVSKTINLPNAATPQEIFDLYLEAWKIGIKAVAVYRDGCKGSQPLSVAGEGKGERAERAERAERVEPGVAAAPREGIRHRLPSERAAITHKFSIDQHEGYLTVGLYEDGEAGEIFIVMAKEGSTISGLMDAFATSVSIALQTGVPLKTLVRKFTHMRFEPAGFTGNPQVPYAKSIVDYIFRWLAAKFLSAEEQQEVGVVERIGDTPPQALEPKSIIGEASDAPSCADCGAIMVRNGACYACRNCGATSGCG